MAYTAETKRKIAWLRKRGFIVGARDTRMNKAFIGNWMVSEPYKQGHEQDDGSGGVWCIVGMSLAQIVDDAYENWCEPPQLKCWVIKLRNSDMWWNNDYGWRSLKKNATRFTNDERDAFNVPMGGTWHRLTKNEM